MEILDKIDGILNEAEEIKLADLPKEQKAFVKSIGIEKAIDQTFHGIHGYIIVVDIRKMKMDTRWTKEEFNKMTKNKLFRWLDFGDDGTFSIGF